MTSSQSSLGPSTSILIVDDDPDIARTIQDLLEYEGYQVQAVSTGGEAITRATEDHFGAVILDLGLPDMDGLSVLRTLSKADPKLPIIILTAFLKDARTIASLREGAFAYLTKPYNRDELKVTLRRAIGVQALAVKAERVERALSESEDRFRSVVETASEAIVLGDQNGNIISWNKAAQALFGYTAEEVLGEPLTIIIPVRFRASHQKGIERLRATGQPHIIGKTVELHGLRKDGSEFPLELSLGTWRTREGAYYSGIIRDITERRRREEALRESQERFRQLAENIREVFWLTDPQKSQMIYISPGYEQIWGRTCGSLYASPQSWLDALHPDDRERVSEAALTKQIAGVYDEEYRIVRPDGSVRWIRDRAFPIRDESGMVYRIAGIADDITERKNSK